LFMRGDRNVIVQIDIPKMTFWQWRKPSSSLRTWRIFWTREWNASILVSPLKVPKFEWVPPS
jgi:hypothetical protein